MIRKPLHLLMTRLITNILQVKINFFTTRVILSTIAHSFAPCPWAGQLRRISYQLNGWPLLSVTLK